MEEKDVPNLDVAQYNLRANQLLAQKVAGITVPPVPRDQMPAFVDNMKNEIANEVY